MNEQAKADYARRLEQQGGRVRRLSLEQCVNYTDYPLYNNAPGAPNAPYVTPQENYCVAQARANVVHVNPIPAPEGWSAVGLGSGHYLYTRDGY